MKIPITTQQAPQPEELQIVKFLKSMDEEMFWTMRCASVCAAFVSGAYISATIRQIADIIYKRHEAMNRALPHDLQNPIDESQHFDAVKDTIEWGIEKGLLTKMAEKIAPTDQGWLIGQDWDIRLSCPQNN